MNREIIAVYEINGKAQLSDLLLQNVLRDDIIQQLFVAMRLNLISIVKDRLKNITTKG